MKPIIQTIIIASELVMLIIQPAHAQLDSIWSAAYGSPKGTIAQTAYQTPDGGLLVAGSEFVEGSNWESNLVRFSATGELAWSVVYTAPFDDWPRVILPWYNGGYMIFGESTSYTAEHNTGIYALCVANDGDLRWSKAYTGSDELDVAAVVMDEHYDYYVLGSVNHRNSEGARLQFDARITKISADGDSLWTRDFGNEDDNIMKDGIRTCDGGIAMVGYEQIRGDTMDTQQIEFLKFDREANLQWRKIYPSYGAHQSGTGLLQLEDGGYLIIAKTWPGTGYNIDGLILRVDANGDSLFSTTVGGEGPDYIESVIHDGNGGYLIYGYYGWELGRFDYWTIQMNADFELGSEKMYGGFRHEMLHDALLLRDGSIILAGQTHTFGGADVFHPRGWLVRMGYPQSVDQPTVKRNNGALALTSAYPNPFNSATSADYTSPLDAPVTATLVDISGRELTSWTGLQAGQGRIVVNGSNLPAGEYWLKVDQDGRSATTKVVLVR